jgi:hypothetical protein
MFSTQATETLLTVRANLLKGLDLVAAHMDAGTLDISLEEKTCPPRGGGNLSLGLLRAVDAELSTRGFAPVLDPGM